MLSIEQLEELDERIRVELDENLTQILTRLNREERLENLLELMGLSYLLKPEPQYTCFDNGTILVLGESKVPEATLLAIAMEQVLVKRRFEFHLVYDEGKAFDCRRIQWNPAYSLVLVGPMPHSSVGKGEDSSVITAMENNEGYPPVVRLGSNALKITKTDFRIKLLEAIDRRFIA